MKQFYFLLVFLSVTIGQVFAQASFKTPTFNSLGISGTGSFSSPAFGDLDNDGDLDAFVINNGGALYYFRNDGSITVPNFTFVSVGSQSNATTPFNIDTNNRFASSITLVDLDADNDLDLLLVDLSGDHFYYQNIGTVSAPNYAAPLTNPFGFFRNSDGLEPNVVFADMDNDGDLDYIKVQFSRIRVYLNNGSITNPSFSSSHIVSSGSISDAQLRIAVLDIDLDGDFDVVAGERHGRFIYFENTGTKTVAQFPQQFTPSTMRDVLFGLTNNASAGLSGRTNTNVVAADLNGDGYKDIFAIAEKFSSSSFFFFERNSPVLATITTTDASSIAADKVDVGGVVTNLGDAGVLEKGIVFSLTSDEADPRIGDANVTKIVVAGDNNTFTETLINLVASTDYSYNVFTTNVVGTSYGTVKTFTTLNLTYFVATSGNDSNDGLSWENAFRNPQTAINFAASGSTIWVATGAYYPDEGAGQTDNSKSSTYNLKEGIKMYGGFSGTETMLSQRDIQTNVTTLSGDLQQNDPVGGNSTGNNSFHVITGTNLTNATILDGFTITRGQSNTGNTSDNNGGGLLLENVAVKFSNLIISRNGGRFGGGVSINALSMSTFDNVVIENNNCFTGSGGVFISNSSPVFTNCIIRANRAQNGGGIQNENSSNSIFNNCIISGNVAFSFNGGGLSNSVDSKFTFNNVTVTGNFASKIGGGLINNTTNSTSFQTSEINNSIFWNNSSNGSTITGDASFRGGNPNSIAFKSSLIANQNIVSGEIVSNFNPLFLEDVSPSSAGSTDGNFRLRSNSPAIKMGSNAEIPSGVTTDLDGNVRIQNTTVDIGAYEGGQNIINQNTTLAQSFESASTDTWNFVLTPITYNTDGDEIITSFQDLWAIIEEFTGVIDNANDGSHFFGARNLDNPSSGGNFDHTIDLEPVFINNTTNTMLSFDYFSRSLASPNFVSYEVVFDNGNTWNINNAISLNGNTNAWTTVSVNIPDGTQFVRLRISTRIDALVNEYLGIDNIRLVSDNITLSSSLMNEKSDTTILFYPNPVVDFINLINLDEQTTFKIFNTLGKIDVLGIVSSKNTIDVSKLSSGVYFLRLEKLGRTLKFIKR